MAVVQMQKVSICALNKYRKNILESVQKHGFMEIDNSVDSEKEFDRVDTSATRSKISKDASQSEKAIEILNLYAPAPKVSFESLRGKPILEDDIYAQGGAKRNELEEISEKLIELDRDVVALNANIAKLTNQIEELVPWMNIDIPISTKGTGTCDFYVGTVSGELTERDVEVAISEKNPDISNFNITKVSSSTDMTYLAVLVHKSESRQLEEALRSIGFSRPSNMVSDTPAKAKEAMAKEIEDNEKEIASLTDDIASYADKREDLKMFADYCRLRASKYEVLGYLPQTKNVFAMEGFVPKVAVPILQEEFTSKYDAIVEARDFEADEEVPVLFKNNGFAAMGEGMMESFGLPKKTEVDPTFIMMIFYVIFFGLMLSDAGYGAILTIATAVILMKFPRMPIGTKRLIKLFCVCGVSTVFWGIMFGSFFGDAIDSIAKTFCGVELAAGETLFKPIWFTPLNDPMRMLMYAMLFGGIHMFTGMILKGYQCAKNKDWGAFIGDFLSWTLFILGLIFMLLPTDLFQSIAGMEFNFPSVVGTLAKGATIVGAILIVFMTARDQKNPGIRVGLGVYGLYDVTSWLSDFLSYSRLLALSLATGSIGSVFNQLGTMGGKSVVGIILFILVFVIGHVLNLAINVLGAYVHSTRLQYVEFFNKFYEGGSRPFAPFFADTKYVDLKGGN